MLTFRRPYTAPFRPNIQHLSEFSDTSKVCSRLQLDQVSQIHTANGKKIKNNRIICFYAPGNLPSEMSTTFSLDLGIQFILVSPVQSRIYGLVPMSRQIRFGAPMLRVLSSYKNTFPTMRTNILIFQQWKQVFRHFQSMLLSSVGPGFANTHSKWQNDETQ
jgi:hypothetical protein